MANKKLLVVEDETAISDLVSRVAEEAGFTARTIRANETFISVYDEFNPDVMVLDISMPDMDGFEVLSFLEKRQSTARVIILSGQTFYRNMAQRLGTGLSLNILDNIAKPFRVSELRELLSKVNHSIVEKAA